MHCGDLNGKEIQKGWNTCIPIADLLCSTVKTQYFKATIVQLYFDFPGGSDGKASVYNAGDLGLIPGSGRSAGEGNGNPLQYYCLENPMDRGAW